MATASIVAALAWCASPASAVIAHLRDGKALSYQPLRQGSAPSAQPRARLFDEILTNLDYNGGPVMPSNTNYTVYWAPPGSPAYPSGYQTGVDRYLEDLAHDSGGHENVDSVATQYNDGQGHLAAYSSHFGGELIDEHAYPANGCSEASKCLTDKQLRDELVRFVKEEKLPIDLEHEYFLLTPPGVEDCFEATGGECSAGSKSPVYCAYHSNVAVEGGQLIYSNDPYVSGNEGCDDGNHPNKSPSDGALEGGLSHEHNESITDPEPNNAWTDWGAFTGENGDKCRTFEPEEEFGTPLGTVEGATYNQVVNGHKYWYQTEWSNQGHTCLQRFTFSGEHPAATFTASPAAGTSVQLDASRSTAPGGVAHYVWQFNDFGEPEPTVETSSPTIVHEFPEEGPVTVALTVMAANGTSAGAARTFTVGGSAPTAAFSVTTPSPAPGAAVAFDASASKAGEGTITKYEWAYGDGAHGEGATPSHTYAKAGSYEVTLTVTNSGNLSSATKHTVIVATAPTAAFSVTTASPSASSPVAFDASASNANEGTITKYEWDFGDGTHGEGATPSHTYSSAGTYEVILTVTNSVARTASVSHSVVVAPATGVAPTAAFSVTTAAPAAGGPVAFDASASKAGEGAITKYEWSFGDGTHGEGATPSHTYAKAGSYEVTLTVTNSTNHTGAVTHTLNVAAAPATGGGEASGASSSGGSGSGAGTGGTLSTSLAPVLPLAPPATVALAGATLSVKASGQAALRLSCSASAGVCAGELVLTLKRRSKGHTQRLTLAKAPFRLPPGTSTVKLQLKRSLLRALGGGATGMLTIRKITPAPATTVTAALHLRLARGH